MCTGLIIIPWGLLGPPNGPWGQIFSKIIVSEPRMFFYGFQSHIVISSYLNRTLRRRHNGCHGVSNHQRLDCLLKRLFRPRSKKTSKLRVTGLCVGNSPVTDEFPTQRASYAEYVSIWWRPHDPRRPEFFRIYLADCWVDFQDLKTIWKPFGPGCTLVWSFSSRVPRGLKKAHILLGIWYMSPNTWLIFMLIICKGGKVLELQMCAGLICW